VPATNIETPVGASTLEATASCRSPQHAGAVTRAASRLKAAEFPSRTGRSGHTSLRDSRHPDLLGLIEGPVGTGGEGTSRHRLGRHARLAPVPHGFDGAVLP